ncbi:MAG: hypothetical protein A3B82_00645 [Methylophilales bacterium RIFCSPHIGHO2_02_FULL_57_10]|nr:MAG: hypothetical protein A3B82_00645 [Methylophilales bacterium RIFCSPHIGHO2_02_FULL_57_10]
MTAFITRYCKRFSLGFLVVLLLAAHAALAAGITVEHAELVPTDEAYQLSADFNVDFSADVEEAINKGVALNFLVEFALMESRNYWFDEEVTSASQVIRLSYHALSRQYLINVGSHQTTFATLQEAVQELGSVQDWPVVEKSMLKKGVPYYAMLRMRLDHNRLPKPLQVSALGSEKWNLISERYRWTPGFDKSSPDK